MILADVLYELSNRVLITDHWSANLARMVIATVSAVTAALLAKLYLSHRTGRMNLCAGVGAVLTYVVVAWAQLVAVSTPNGPLDLTALNLGVLAAVILSLVGTIRAMNVRLFTRKPPPATRTERAISQLSDDIAANASRLDANTDTLAAIDRVVNTRPEGEPTIGEDVRHIEERGVRDDKRREEES